MRKTAARTTGRAMAALVAAMAAAGATTAQAGTVAALVDGNAIAWIDTTSWKVTGSVKLDGGASLVAIDVRPADGRLYGLAQDGTVVTVDAKTGKWQKTSQLSEKLPSGVAFSMDFNPVVDRLRVVASDGTNLRINVDDGKAIVDGRLKHADDGKGKGKTPRVTAASYLNSFAGAKETTLYNVDAATGWFTKQAPPNDGVLVAVGELGVKLDGPVALDIASDGKGGNSAWLLADGTMHQIDLASGKAKAVGKIGGLTGKVIDMAVLPPS
jgi:outer membrane protein assembly factor BamB